MTAEPTPDSSSPAKGRERRRWPRARADWPITLEAPEGSYEARVRDISTAGVCFFLDRPLSVMTALGIELELSLEDRSNRRVSVIRGQGVVVRCEKISEHLEHFEIALFMPDFSEAEKSLIERYVAANPEHAPT
ncbi:MAG: PilZ domain-containing protein [bacterium]|jgi:hypothetical protein|nr:PilZ domain-containing protein [Planctomycetota bacterium]HIL50631.1 PilZ domain-containing protein [Planctomycetota bacterium]